MKRILLTVMILFSGASLWSATKGEELLLVEKNVSVLPISVDKNASQETMQAAKELASYIQKISGAEVDIILNDSTNTPSHAIWVGVQPKLENVFPDMKFKFENPEEILIACNGQDLVIAGRDRMAGDTQTEFGTANAVYTFLQKYLDVRWFWPGPLGEDLICKNTIRLPSFEYRFHPQIVQRKLWRGTYGGEYEVQAKAWFRMQRATLYSFQFSGGHAFTKWWDKYHAEHPDYFAVQPDGTREASPSTHDVKICVSNPKMQKQWLDDAEQALKEDPSRIMASASPNDGAVMGECVCPECKAWDNPKGEEVQLYGKGGAYKSVVLTDRYVKFWNILAKGLKERFPDRDVYVGAYAYGPYKLPPLSEKMDKNIVVGYVGHFPFSGNEFRIKEKEDWKKWADNASKMVFRPNIFHYSGGWLGLPTIPLNRTIEDFKFLAENKCVGLEVDTLPIIWATQGIEYYLLAQLAYDPLQDGNALLKDYYQRCFGNASSEMEQYFSIMEKAHDQIAEKAKLSSGAAKELIGVCREIYTDDILNSADECIKKAEAKVADDHDIKYSQRVAFNRSGFDFTRLQVGIMNEMAKVRESKGTDANAVKKAIELCAKRDAFYNKINDLLQKSIKLQVEIISTMSKVRSSSEKDTAADKEQLALAFKKAIELCENRSELYKKPDVFAMRSQKWYHDSRKLDDYMGPPSKAFRDAAGVECVPQSK
jgi:hypothetical protein